MNDPDAKFTANSNMVAFDATNKTFKTISAGEDISAYVHDNNFKLYKGGSTTANLVTGDKAKTGLLVVHEDAASSGVAQAIGKDTVVTAGNGITTVTGGVATADTNYKIYEEINLVADTTTDAAHEAYAKLQDDVTTKTSFDIKFEGLGTDTATAEKKAEGQNALKTELSNIKYTFDGTKEHSVITLVLIPSLILITTELLVMMELKLQPLQLQLKLVKHRRQVQQQLL